MRVAIDLDPVYLLGFGSDFYYPEIEDGINEALATISAEREKEIRFVRMRYEVHSAKWRIEWRIQVCVGKGEYVFDDGHWIAEEPTRPADVRAALPKQLVRVLRALNERVVHIRFKPPKGQS